MRAKPLILAAGLLLATTLLSAPVAHAQSGRGGKTPVYAAPPGAATPFSGRRAYEHVKRLVELGPRPSGSKELESARRYILGQAGGRLEEWTADTPAGKLKMANVVVELKGEADDAIVIANPRIEEKILGERVKGKGEGSI